MSSVSRCWSRRRGWPVISSRLALLSVVAAAIAAPLAAQTRAIERGRHTISAPSIRIFNPAGRIEVRAWDRDSMHVVAEFSDPRLGFFSGGSESTMKMGLELREGADAGADTPPAILRVQVPRGTRLWIKSASASIEVSGITGDLDLASVNGRMDVTASPTVLTVEGMDGAVTVRGNSSVTRIKTAGGAVTVEGDPGDLTVSTVAGDIRLQLSAPVQRALVTSVNGEIVMSGAVANGGRVELQTHAAPVELRMPATQRADVLVSAFSGKVFSGFPDTERTALPGQPVRYRIGGGGAEIIVRSLKGSVMIAREKR